MHGLRFARAAKSAEADENNGVEIFAPTKEYAIC
jgi:hypothetical protein